MSWAMVKARRVLPTPPGPTRVRSGTASSRRNLRAVNRSSSRPMSRVRGIGGEPSGSAEAEATSSGSSTVQETVPTRVCLIPGKGSK